MSIVLKQKNIDKQINALTATCPKVPAKLVKWRHQWLWHPVPEIAARPGFYKLDMDDEHPHW